MRTQLKRPEVKLFVLEQLREKETIRTQEIAKRAPTTLDTARRALVELEAEGLLQRFHGGAQGKKGSKRSRSAKSNGSLMRSGTLEAVAKLIGDHQAVILEWSPLTEELHKYVSRSCAATIITNSPLVAVVFSEHENIKVRVIGGKLHNGSLIPVHEEEFAFLSGIRPELCVLGSCKLHLTNGITVSHSEAEARLKQLMIANASHVVAAVSADEIGTSGMYVVAPFQRLTHIALLGNGAGAKLKLFKAKGVEIL